MCHDLSGHKAIVFCWVPNHIGIQGNARAMFWPKLPQIKQNKITIYHTLISSTTSLSTLMTFRKVNRTSMSPASCSKYNQPLSDLSQQWNADEMTFSYAGPELAVPISQTDVYREEYCDLCAAILVSL